MSTLSVHRDGRLRDRAHGGLPDQMGFAEDVAGGVVVFEREADRALLGVVLDRDFGEETNRTSELLLQRINKSDVVSRSNSQVPGASNGRSDCADCLVGSIARTLPVFFTWISHMDFLRGEAFTERTKPTSTCDAVGFVDSVRDIVDVAAGMFVDLFDIFGRRKRPGIRFGQEYLPDPRFTAKAYSKGWPGRHVIDPAYALDPVQDGGEPDRAHGSLLRRARVVK